MKHNLIKTTVLALLGSALVAHSASAAVITVSPGDLILGVEATGGTGASFDYEADLGNILAFQGAAPGSTIDLSGRVSATDLSSTSASGGFGTGFSSRTDLLWSVVGTTQGTDLGTAKQGSLFLSSVSDPGAKTSAQLATSRVQVNSIALNNSTSTANSSQATFATVSDPTSYTSEENASVGFFGLNTQGSVSFGSGSSLELFELDTVDGRSNTGVLGTSTDLGTLTFVNGNDLQFVKAGAAVPEPSTYALVVFGGALLFWQIKRRNSIAGL